ncbi:MAG: G5 domain-containing protein [Alicyclobacillus sp.]|nr:G5 domain-containing protein [Alicyclobacillus sp.]
MSKALYLSAVAAVAVSGTAGAVAGRAYKTVVVQDGGQQKVFHGWATGDVESFLRAHGVKVATTDRLQPDGHTPVQDGMVVTVVHPLTVHMVDGRLQYSVQTLANTVGELLQQQAIQLGPEDRVEQPLSAPLRNGMTVRIHRTEKQVSVKTQSISFQTIRQRDDSMYEGEQKVLTHGVEGLLEVQTTSVYVDGHQTGQSVTQRVVRPPVNQVVLVGTRPRPYVLSARGVGSLLIKRQLTVVATAYAAGGHTSTGDMARPGVVAVDPNVIPLGSKLYIPGVGVVIAADTGSAIRGTRIDVCMGSEAEAEAWGVRTVTVYELAG